MPKNQLIKVNFEKSITQRWSASDSKVAKKLIEWNKKINAEIEEKQKQEQEKLEQQKLKDLKQQELQKANSSSTNTEQSPTEATGAIPKQRKQNGKRRKQCSQEQGEQSQKMLKENEEQRAKQKAEELQKEQEQYYSKLKEILGVHFKNVKCKIAGILISGIARIYCKEKELKVACISYMAPAESKEFNSILKPYINAYYIYFILNFLLDMNYITINWKNLSSKLKELFKSDLDEFTRRLYSDFSSLNFCNTYNQLCSKSVKYKIDVPKSLSFKVFENEKERKIIDDLVSEFNQFDQILSTLLEDNYINFHDRQNQETACKFLEYAMKKSGYEEKIDKVLKELTKQHQPSPNSSVEEASTKPNSTRKTNGQAL